jgi:LPXTG-site transpeptidase (sortase) family protein
MIQKIPLSLRVVSLYVLVAIPLLGYGAIFVKPIVAQAILQPRGRYVKPKKIISGKPVKLIIERLNIRLNVVEGTYNQATNSWTLTDSNVQFADLTALPNNETGNTFLYGHNTEAVLAPTQNFKLGDQLKLKTANGHTFSYKYIGDQLTVPSDVSSLSHASKKPVVTLVTCAGFWSEQRRVMKFEYVEVV